MRDKGYEKELNLGELLLYSMPFFQAGDPAFCKDLGDGVRLMRINEEVYIHPLCVYAVSKHYKARAPSKAWAELGEGCLDTQTMAEYVENALIQRHEKSIAENELEKAKSHLNECDYCFNMMLTIYSDLTEDPAPMDLPKDLAPLKC